jgi:predicted metal-dependent TIM-barrel fold hydrolase
VRFIDSHLHSDMIEDSQLQKLVMMGMEAAVIPSPHMFLGDRDADTVLLLWERLLTMEVNTARTLGFEALASFRMRTGAMVGLSVCWDKMPPEVAARFVIDNPEGRGRILINSELGGQGNDYFTVPGVTLAMRPFGLVGRMTVGSRV